VEEFLQKVTTFVKVVTKERDHMGVLFCLLVFLHHLIYELSSIAAKLLVLCNSVAL